MTEIIIMHEEDAKELELELNRGYIYPEVYFTHFSHLPTSDIMIIRELSEQNTPLGQPVLTYIVYQMLDWYVNRLLYEHSSDRRGLLGNPVLEALVERV